MSRELLDEIESEHDRASLVRWARTMAVICKANRLAGRGDHLLDTEAKFTAVANLLET